MFKDILAELARRFSEIPSAALIDNRHFAETIYRTALAGGIMNRLTYRDLPDDA
jgi:hypothetical protein